MSLPENIYKFRTEQNMSQLDLADALEVSRQSVSKWETGSAVPELDKLVKMCDLFDVSLDVLVGRKAAQLSVDINHEKKGASVTVREIIGAFLFCPAVIILIVFSIRASLGLEAGVYYALVLSSAATALCWPSQSKVQLCFGVLDALFVLVQMIMRQNIAFALFLSIPFWVIYGIWAFLVYKK